MGTLILGATLQHMISASLAGQERVKLLILMFLQYTHSIQWAGGRLGSGV